MTDPGLTSSKFPLTDSNNGILLEMYKNDLSVISLFGKAEGHHSHAGNSVILHLKAGDNVYVKADGSYGSRLYGASDRIYNTFTGVYLAQNKQGAIGKVLY